MGPNDRIHSGVKLIQGPAVEPVSLVEVRRQALVDPPAAILSSSVANPSVITTYEDHAYVTGDLVTISDHTGSSPSINNQYQITVTGARTFTVPVNVTVGGTSGAALRPHRDDAYLASLILAARQHLDGLDGMLGRALITQTWELVLDRFPLDEIRLPMPPLQSVVSVKYDNAQGVETLVPSTDYVVDTTSWYGWVVPVATKLWPSTLDAINAVRIRFIAGYGDAGLNVPAPIRQAMLLLITHWYEERTPVNIGNIVNPLPYAVEALLAPFVVGDI